ncbi:hypothetical protein ADK54_09475 [Streptomyces sp. WM6378]|nr:hypothetical protein ADK54_09475 [Streptomyces sp. WM6378]
MSHLPQEETDLIRACHELGYETARQEAASGERLVRCLGLDLMVPPEVLAPAPVVAEVLGRSVLRKPREAEECWTWAPGAASMTSWPQDAAVMCWLSTSTRTLSPRQPRTQYATAVSRSLMDRSGLRRTVVDWLKRERDSRLVEYIAYRLSR